MNEVIIPVKDKDMFNRTTPDRDAELYGKYVVKPELAAILNAPVRASKAPETNRADIVLAVLQGLPGLNQHSKDPKPVDTIKINLGIPPAASPKPPRRARGRPAGLPERPPSDRRRGRHRPAGRGGRAGRPEVLGRRTPASARKCPNPADLGDGVHENDKSFLNTFPYLAEPNSGLNSRIKKDYPTP